MVRFFVENNEDHLIVRLVFDDHLGYHLNILLCTPIDTGKHIPIERDNLSSFVFDSVMFISNNTFKDEVIRYTLIGKKYHMSNFVTMMEVLAYQKFHRIAYDNYKQLSRKLLSGK